MKTRNISKVTSNKSKFLLALFILSFSALVAYQGISGNVYTFRQNDNVEQFNQTIDSLQDEDVSLNEVIDSLSRIERLSDKDSFVDTISKYNIAYLLATHPEVDIEKLRIARQLLVEALRARPNDIDIRKNLELITSMLIERVQEKFEDAGMSEEEAKEAAVGQEIGEMPSSGDEPNRNDGNEQDY